MYDVTKKNKRINELVEQEVISLKVRLDQNADLLKKEEADILEMKKALEKSESNAVVYRSNISALKEQIEVLK